MINAELEYLGAADSQVQSSSAVTSQVNGGIFSTRKKLRSQYFTSRYKVHYCSERESCVFNCIDTLLDFKTWDKMKISWKKVR